mmetsp:Transcript_3458/g.7744  ORF Transcript_3458/g.7744 Transcript_3458/m.7744 type:complete len:99 (-) Transcript_3458:305-601(-)
MSNTAVTPPIRHIAGNLEVPSSGKHASSFAITDDRMEKSHGGVVQKKRGLRIVDVFSCRERERELRGSVACVIRREREREMVNGEKTRTFSSAPPHPM